MIELVIIVIFTVILFGYLWLKQRFQFWEKRGIPYLKTESLFLGNNLNVFRGKLSVSENVQKQYNALAPHRFGGVYFFSKPVLIVRDPELIKRILIKDFQYFHDRVSNMADMNDPLTMHLFFMGGEEWSALRQKLTPTFTSGKMKILFELMNECVEKMEKIIEKSAIDQMAVDVKDLMARYTTDVISSCAFGLEADSLRNPNSEFRVNGKQVFAASPKRRLFDFLFNTCPALLRIFRFSGLDNSVRHFFIDLVNDTITYRQKNSVVRNDFLDLLVNVHKNFDFSIPAQCFLFFVAGFDTSSNSLSFILYKLAKHPDVQQKVQDEIDRVLKLYDGKITYDSLQEMHYMDRVFDETLRLFPIVPQLQRICVKDYRFPDSDYVMKKGEMLFIPVRGLHRDPQYFRNPDVFNPENFSDEAKSSRPPCTFLPFGDGPRHCIGVRFGTMQVKLALTTIMREYTVTISSQMKCPVELQPYTILTSPKDDILLNFNKRNK